MENLNKLQSKIYKTTGIKTTITRFPGGSSNTISKFNPGIMTRLSKLVVQKGYTYYDKILRCASVKVNKYNLENENVKENDKNE